MAARPAARELRLAWTPLWLFLAATFVGGQLVQPVRGFTGPCAEGICGCDENQCDYAFGDCAFGGTPSACGDPHMTGLHGETFDWHGIPGKHFCLVSDNLLQLNVHLTGQTGIKATEEGTWFDAFGVLYTVGGKTHALTVEPNKTADLDDDANLVITLDGTAVPPDAFADNAWHHIFGDLRVFRSAASKIILSQLAENGIGLNIAVEGLVNVTLVTDTHEHPNGKHFDLHVHHMNVSSRVHGVLGQTFQPSRSGIIKAAMARNGPAVDADELIDGSDESYQTTSLLDPFCKYGRFGSLDTGTEGPGVSFRRRVLRSLRITDEAPYQLAIEPFSCHQRSGSKLAHTCSLVGASHK